MNITIKILFLLILTNKITAQNTICADEKPLNIQILDKYGFVKTSNFCQGEEVTFKVEGNFDRYIWGINNDNSDLNRAYFYEPTLKIKLPYYQAHITISTYKKGDACYGKGSKSINDFITTQRNLIVADSAFVGEEIIISTNFHNFDDILYTPYDTLFNFSGFEKINFQANQAGTYKLVNERINNKCGNHDLEKTVYLTNNIAQTTLEITNATNNKLCEGWLLEIGLKPVNLKIKNPNYTVYISSSPNFIKDNYYERLAYITTENGLIVKPDYNLSGKYLFVREQYSGVYSNVIGPFKPADKTKATAENLEILQYPQTILSQGDSTIYHIKSNLNAKIFWMDNSNIINQQADKLTIKRNGYFWPIFTYDGECVSFGNNYKALYVSDFESIIPSISVSKSCEKKNYLKLDLRAAAQFRDTEIKTKLKIRWFRNGIFLKETQELEFIATQLGNYHCEVWDLEKMIESNKVFVKDFNKDIATVKVFGYPLGSNICANADFAAKLYTDAYNYTLSNSNNFQEVVRIKATDSLYIFNWFIDNELQTNHSPKLELPASKDKFSLKLMVNDGECNYISAPQIIQTKNITLLFFKPKYEFCENNIGEILAPIDESIGTGNAYGTFEWYKDGKLFLTKFADFTASINDINLKTKEPGTYFLVRKTVLKSDPSINCTITSNPFEIILKKNLSIKSDQYLKRLCPTDPLLGLRLPNTNFEKIEWFFNDKLVVDQTLNYSTNRDSTYLQLNTAGSYFAKITYPNDCIATSEVLNFDGTNDFEIIKTGMNEAYCKGDEIMPSNFYELRNIPFEYTWQRDSLFVSINQQIIPQKSGTYQLTAKHSNGNCTLKSKPIKISLPNTNYDLSLKDSTSLCIGSKLAVNLLDSMANILTWFNENKSIESADTINIKTKGTYQAFFNNANCPNDYHFSNTLKVTEIPTPTATISGSKTFNYGQSAELKIELTSNPPWQIKLNTGEDFTIEKSPYLLTVRPLNDTKYTLNSVKNICGLGAVSGDAVVRVVVLGDELAIKESAINVFPNPSSDAINIEFPKNTIDNATIELVDILGNIVKKQKFEHKFKNTNQLNISELPAGLYQLNIFSNQKIIHRKIIKD